MTAPLKTTRESSIEITPILRASTLTACTIGWRARAIGRVEMPRAVFDRAVRGSLCFGALEQNTTVGFARVISDRATFAYVSDVFVDPARRGTGISKAMMSAIVAHPELQDLRLWVLDIATPMACMPVTALHRLPHRSATWSGATPRSISG